MRIQSYLALGLTLALTSACADSATDPGATSPAAAATGPAGSHRLTVMTQNMYIGADVDAVIGALATPDPDDDLTALVTAIETLQRTDFPARAAALADEIAKQHPDVIGLQEVSQVHVDLTALGVPTTVDLDFLPVLLGALSARGLNYAVGGVTQNIVAKPFPGISVVDYDAILVDPSRVQTRQSLAAPYSTNIGVVAPGVELKRGWVMVRATVDGADVTIASTHLESGGSADIRMVRAAQATELAGLIGPDANAIVLGDLNENPDSSVNAVLKGAGFSDVWVAMHPGAPGLTCCQASPDLSDQTPNFDQRIDYVWARGLAGADGKLQGQITIIGNTPGDRVQGSAGTIWPSDHAGLVAEFRWTK